MAIEGIYKAINLLDKILDFKALTPDTNSWNEDSLRDNPPRFIRLKQINSLIEAFGFKDNVILFKKTYVIKGDEIYIEKPNKSPIQAVLNGDFILKRHIDDYKDFINYVKDILDQDYSEIYLEGIVDMYKRFVEYKERLYKIFDFNSGILCCGPGTYFSIYLTDSVNKEIIDKTKRLDDILEIILNPKKLEFSEEKLIKNYNFPTENLNAIDIDWV